MCVYVSEILHVHALFMCTGCFHTCTHICVRIRMKVARTGHVHACSNTRAHGRALTQAYAHGAPNMHTYNAGEPLALAVFTRVSTHARIHRPHAKLCARTYHSRTFGRVHTRTVHAVNVLPHTHTRVRTHAHPTCNVYVCARSHTHAHVARSISPRSSSTLLPQRYKILLRSP